MKKMIAFLLSFLFLVSLTACGSEPQEPEAPETPPQEEKVVIPPEQLDYNTIPFEDWLYTDNTMPDPFDSISRLNNVPYGTAGSTYQAACAAVDLLVLSTEPDSIRYIEQFMEPMTPIQRDYFSRSWDMALEDARAAFSDSGEALLMVISGFTDPQPPYDVDMSLYTQNDLNDLSADVEDLFTTLGVTRAWTAYAEQFTIN